MRALSFAMVIASVVFVGCAGKVADTSPHDDGGSAGASSGGASSGDGVSATTGTGAGTGLGIASGASTSGTIVSGTDAMASTGDTSSSGTATGSADAGGGDGGACLNLDLSTYDTTCKHDSDCVSVAAGPICSGYTCVCPGGAAINMSGQARYDAAIASIQRGKGPICNCPAAPVPRCLGGVCIAGCAGYATDPPACHSTVADAGRDGGTCVEVDLATYDRSCQTANDCMGITAGTLCPGSCACGGAAVNVSEGRRYMDSLGQASTSLFACPCPASGQVGCVQNVCTVCGFGGCPDGG